MGRGETAPRNYEASFGDSELFTNTRNPFNGPF